MDNKEFWKELYLAYTKRGDEPGVAKAKADDGIKYADEIKPMMVNSLEQELDMARHEFLKQQKIIPSRYHWGEGKYIPIDDGIETRN